MEGGKKKENKGPRWHRRRGHAHDVAEEQQLCATSLAVVVINLGRVHFCRLLPVCNGAVALWTGPICQQGLHANVGHYCVAHAVMVRWGWRGGGRVCVRTHDRGEGSSEECEQVTVAEQSR